MYYGVHMKHYKKGALLFADARRSLLGHLATAVWSLLLFMLLSLFLNQIAASFAAEKSILSFIISVAAAYVTSLFISLFGVGLSSVFLNLQYGQPASMRNLLVCFRENQDRAVQTRAYVTLGERLCLFPLQLLLFLTSGGPLAERAPLLLGVGGASIAACTLWTLTYAMTNFLLLDFPDTEAGQILRASRSMMRGNRLRLLLLMLRLLPMHLLGIFSLGLANIYAGCCQHACAAAFYKDMMDQQVK